MRGGKRKNKEEEADVDEYEKQGEGDRRIAGDEADQREGGSRLARPFDLVSRHVAGDDCDQTPETPASDHGRGAKRDADDGPRVVGPRDRSGVARRGRRRRRWAGRRLHAGKSSSAESRPEPSPDRRGFRPVLLLKIVSRGGFIGGRGQ